MVQGCVFDNELCDLAIKVAIFRVVNQTHHYWHFKPQLNGCLSREMKHMSQDHIGIHAILGNFLLPKWGLFWSSFVGLN